MNPVFSKWAHCWLNEPPPLEILPPPSSQKIYYNNDETQGIPFVIWQGAEKTIYGTIFDEKMRQLCGKQTRLCGQISKDDKLIKTLSECTEQQWNEK